MRRPKELRRQIDIIKRLERQESRLRFGLRYLAVSDIANQYYCEKQVELRKLHGEEETEAIKIGKVGHEEAVRFAEAVSPERAWTEAFRQNRRKPYEIADVRLISEYKGVPIIGVPDHLSVKRGKALIVRELKFRSRLRVYRADFIQLRLYGFLLAHCGFDTSELQCEVVCLHPKLKDVAAFYETLTLPLGNFIKKSDMDVARQPFSMTTAVKELDWALQFWWNRRRAIPTTVAAKCQACQFRTICPASQAGSDQAQGGGYDAAAHIPSC